MSHIDIFFTCVYGQFKQIFIPIINYFKRDCSAIDFIFKVIISFLDMTVSLYLCYDGWLIVS